MQAPFPDLEGWSRRITTEGAVLGREGATVTVKERVRPYREPGAIVAAALAELEVTGATWVTGDREAIHTVEGEAADVVVLTAEVAGVPFERALGVIAGDDFVTVIDGVGRRSQGIAPLVQGLTAHKSLGLGEHRRRLPVFGAPAGWTVTRGLLHTDVSRPGALIRVGHARRLDAPSPRLEEKLYGLPLEGFAVEREEPRRPLVAAPGMRAAATRTWGKMNDGAEALVAVATLDDGRHGLCIRLVTAGADVEARWLDFSMVVRSVAPLSVPRRHESGSAAMSHWAA